MQKRITGFVAAACALVLLWIRFGGPLLPVGLPLSQTIGWKTYFILENAVEMAVIVGAAAILIASRFKTGGGRVLVSEVAVLWAQAAIFLVMAGCAVGGLMIRRDQDAVLQDAYYVVAHFRDVMHIGATFLLFALFYFWFPRVTGFRTNARLGKAHAWLTFVGVVVAVSPPALAGLSAMPRRSADYPDAYAGWNLVSTAGIVIAASGVLVFVAVLAEAFIRRRPAAAAA